jgi:hypothetical protein
MPFETIAKDEGFYTGRGYGGEKPNLVVLATSNDVENPGLDIQFPPEIAAQLRSSDYNRFVIVLVLQGLQGSTEHSVTVQQVRRQGNRVIINAQFVKPVPGVLVGWLVTSPFHLIAIPKQGTWGQSIRFVLMSDTNVAAETTHFVP